MGQSHILPINIDIAKLSVICQWSAVLDNVITLCFTPKHDKNDFYLLLKGRFIRYKSGYIFQPEFDLVYTMFNKIDSDIEKITKVRIDDWDIFTPEYLAKRHITISKPITISYHITAIHVYMRMGGQYGTYIKEIKMIKE